MPESMKLSASVDFSRAAETLLGEGWHREVARLLGDIHPDGPRHPIDVRTVRRWASGSRPIPSWVPDAMADALRREATELLSAAAALERRRATSEE